MSSRHTCACVYVGMHSHVCMNLLGNIKKARGFRGRIMGHASLLPLAGGQWKNPVSREAPHLHLHLRIIQDQDLMGPECPSYFLFFTLIPHPGSELKGRMEGRREKEGQWLGWVRAGVAPRDLELFMMQICIKALHCLPRERSLKLKSNYNE